MSASRSQSVLVAAALAYAGAAAISSLVAVRDDVPGEPLGIGVPLPVPTALAVGWGAGIAPPWVMPAAAVLASHRAAGGRARAAGIAGAIGGASIAGHLIEPVTWRPRSWSASTAASIALTMTASAGLAAAGLSRYRTIRAAEA